MVLFGLHGNICGIGYRTSLTSSGNENKREEWLCLFNYL